MGSIANSSIGPEKLRHAGNDATRAECHVKRAVAIEPQQTITAKHDFAVGLDRNLWTTELVVARKNVGVDKNAGAIEAGVEAAVGVVTHDDLCRHRRVGTRRPVDGKYHAAPRVHDGLRAAPAIPPTTIRPLESMATLVAESLPPLKLVTTIPWRRNQYRPSHRRCTVRRQSWVSYPPVLSEPTMTIWPLASSATALGVKPCCQAVVTMPPAPNVVSKLPSLL